jgi:16S rRNA (guanine966-N2)-methyltransferase
MLRILAGEYRSRLLASPRESDRTRPYTGRVKESLFNLLRGWFEDARVLDLFAGVGTVGLEAASRGAREVFCVERDREILGFLERNIASLGCGDRVRAISGDALSPALLPRCPGPFDLVFLDPPYELMEEESQRERILTLAARCRSLMGDRGFLVLRRPVTAQSPPAPAIEGFDGPEAHRHGASMEILLYMPRPPAAAPATGAV